MEHFIFIFLDGVGVGKPEDFNPFYVNRPEYLPFYEGGLVLPDGTPIKPIDATLGVEGIPQSGSGQTSLYTGENIPKLMGHRDSYPSREMRRIIVEKNILSRLKARGMDAVFINAYPVHHYLFTDQHIRLMPSGELQASAEVLPAYRRRLSVTSCMMLAAGQPPFTETDILNGRSLFQDFTNRWLIEKGMRIPEFTPEIAAQNLFHASRLHDFTLYEYFQTDLYGHRRTFDEQLELIDDLNRFLRTLFSLLNPKTDTLLLTGDHGNLEDGTTRGHTLNPVPLIVWGNQAERLRDRIHDLAEVTPAILDHLTGSHSRKD